MKIRKKLAEKRNSLIDEMSAIVDKAKNEERVLTKDEIEKIDGLKAEVQQIDDSAAAEEGVNGFADYEIKVEPENSMTDADKDIHDFASVIRSYKNADASQMKKGDNGAVIPATIANKIIDKVTQLSPVYQLATKYKIKGTLTIPYVDTSTDDITVAYAADFTEVTSHTNKFANISLTGYLYGSLVEIGKQLLNNSDFALVDFVVNRMAEKIAAFIDNELINGTTDKTAGIKGSVAADMKITLAAPNAITADELIDIQEAVPDVYQGSCIWIMNKKTRTAIRKLKDGDGNYLLQRDATSKWGYVLFGKDVYTSDNMPVLGAEGNMAVIYGDMSGLAVKEAETAEIQVLNELYATKHAVGVVAWGEIDAKIENGQKIAVAICGTAK